MTDSDEEVNDDELSRDEIETNLGRLYEDQFIFQPTEIYVPIRDAAGRTVTIRLALEHRNRDDIVWTSLPGTWTDGPPIV